MHKAFPQHEVLISKGERFINFLRPQSVSRSTQSTSRKDLLSKTQVRQSLARTFFCTVSDFQSATPIINRITFELLIKK